MVVSSIKQQVKHPDRYSIFVDDAYSFSLSADALLSSGLYTGQELTEAQVTQLKKDSADEKLYTLTLRYAALRPRSRSEITSYLERKDSPAPLIEQITNKLIKLGMVDDAKFATSYVHDRRLLRPTSRRKMILELQKKHISKEVIEEVVGHDMSEERTALAEIVARKRRQLAYRDDIKLMQYLSRQGFSYGDIKTVLGGNADYTDKF
jgi:regulatory protein